jgi:hypothetical protein
VAFDIESYEESAEAFLTELDREYHLHFSGQKRDYEVEAVYDRHRSLFERDRVERLREAVAAGQGENRRRAELLLEFAVDGFLGRATATEQAAIAEREAVLELEVDGERIPYRSAPVAQANEPDPERRRRIEERRIEALVTEIDPLHRAALRRSHELVGELAWPSYAEAFAELRGIDLRALAGQAQSFLVATADAYAGLVEPELRAVLGYGLADARRADLARFFRAPGLDDGFRAERLIPLFTATMESLGLDLAAQPNIILDTEQRPTKSPRAYCAPVRVPAEIYLVVPRVGGREDFAALFHEGGHAEHYANMDPGLPVSYRYLGDNSVTESFAFLLEHVAEDRHWLADVLATDPEPVVSHVRAVRIYFLRRYAAKLIYELELHGRDSDSARLPDRYSKLLGDATGIEWPRETWLEDVDSGFYVAAYLRAWALEARWRQALRARFGERWHAEPEAGRWLRGIWSQGQRKRADELLAETTGEELRFEVLAEEPVASG